MCKIEINTIEIDTSESNRHLQPKTFDAAVFFNSSESRALAYHNLFDEKSIKCAFLVDFDGGGNVLKKDNLSKNLEYLDRIADSVIRLNYKKIADYKSNLDSIADGITRCCSKGISNLFMDITGVPLIYSVALVKFFLRLFPVPMLTILNVSGRYARKGEELFSEGNEFDIYIPGYYGTPDHSKLVHYVFFLGYDGDRSLNIFRDNLPDKVSVVIPSPGYDEGNDLHTFNNNKEFLNEVGFNVNGNSFPKNDNRGGNLYKIKISDVQAIFNLVEKIYNEDNDRYELRLVPLGPKPHALGAALAAVFNNDISIMYQFPKIYYMNETPPGEKMWLYNIKVSI